MTREVAEQDASTVAPPLTDQQTAVLQAVYDYFHDHAAWPTFITIDWPIRREHRWDTGAIVLSLPESLIIPPRPGHLRPIASDELRLRLPGIQACRGGSEDTERFVKLLRWFAERERAYEPQPGGRDDEMPRVTSAEVGQYLGLGDTDQLALKRLLLMLQLDNWALGSSGSNGDSWYVMLGQDIWRFQDVQTVEDCLAAREAWFAEGSRFTPVFTRQPVFVLPPEEPPVSEPVPPASSPYVNGQVVDAIRSKGDQSKFDVTKLLSLVRELNDNYADRNTYASHALLRAILDHIPPILGYPDFKGVVNNYGWGRTDRNYIKRLAEFRDQADDALHRQISSKPDVLAFEDMPTSVCIDRLLQECAELL